MKLMYTLTFLFSTFVIHAQTNTLRINQNLVLPKDSLTRTHLTASLNDFLLAAQKPNEENKFVFADEKIETFIQLDEINGIEMGRKSNLERIQYPRIEIKSYFSVVDDSLVLLIE